MNLHASRFQINLRLGAVKLDFTKAGCEVGMVPAALRARSFAFLVGDLRTMSGIEQWVSAHGQSSALRKSHPGRILGLYNGLAERRCKKPRKSAVSGQFAVLCVTTPPSGQRKRGNGRAAFHCQPRGLAKTAIRPYLFSTGGGRLSLASVATADMDSLATPVCYWHITVEELRT